MVVFVPSGEGKESQKRLHLNIITATGFHLSDRNVHIDFYGKISLLLFNLRGFRGYFYTIALVDIPYRIELGPGMCHTPTYNINW